MLQPLHDYLLVEIDETDEDVGIIKTRDVRDDIMGRKGKILAIGPGTYEFGVFIVPKEIKVGDTVYWEEAAEANTPQDLKDLKPRQALVKYARLTAIVKETK